MKNTSDFFKKINNAYPKLPFVAYNKPNSTTLKGIVQNNDQLHTVSLFTESGFVFAPFDNLKQATLLKPNLLFQTEITPTSIQQNNSNYNYKNNYNKQAHLNYLTLVSKTLHQINTSGIHKIVVSRKEAVSLKEIDFINTFKQLLHLYPNAFVYMWHHPKIGLWIGATPEQLLHTNNNAFSTMALAGTQLYENTIQWSVKNKVEQQYVTDYMEQQLQQNFSNLQISAPYTVKAGHLAHLRSNISGNFTANNQLQLLINCLHPSPAICGMPKNQAKSFILKNELYERQFYTGFLGEMNVNNSCDLYVNLRCMEVDKNLKGHLYIGGGITNASTPEKEWEESVQKSHVIKKALVFKNCKEASTISN